VSYLGIKVVSAFLLPPLCFLLLGIVGLLSWRKWPVFARRAMLSMVLMLWIFSMPVVGNALLIVMERGSHGAVALPTRAQAIVVLGGGVYLDAPEYQGGTVGKETLERIRYAAKLYHLTRLPILVTGGDVEGSGFSEGGMMKKALEEDFNVPVKWAETASTDTIENVAYSKKMLEVDGVKTVLLVTHGWHMERSRRLFERAGFEVITAGTGFHRFGKINVLDFLPSVEGLYGSRLFFHEVIGSLWAKIHQPPNN